MNKLKNFFFNINKRKLIIGSFFVILLLFTYCFFNYNKLVAVYNLEKDVEKKIEDMDLILGGNTVGIKLLATGVLGRT